MLWRANTSGYSRTVFHILVWSELLERKLKEKKLVVVGDAAAFGFVCRKCHRALEVLKNQKEKILQSMEEAIKFVDT